MKKHGWVLPILAEFFPTQTNLLGINCNRGAKICIRLRPAHDPNSFLPLEESLIGTMLHELTHNLRGPHDQIFYKHLDELTEEYEKLRASGYDGEGFLGKGSRVGLGVGHDKGVSLEEARRRALKKLEERERVARLLGKGGKLGGAVPDMRGKRMGDVLAEVNSFPVLVTAPADSFCPSQAAERRQRDAKACGHSDEHEKLPAELQAEVDRSAAESRSVMIDLTKDSDDEEDYYPQAGPSGARSSGQQEAGDVKPDIGGGGGRSSSPELEIHPPPPRVPAKRPPPPATASSGNKAPSLPRARPPPRPKPAAAAAAWTCPTCTFDNASALSLACECCLTQRPEEVTVALGSSSTSKSAAGGRGGGGGGGGFVLEEGWACESCSTLNEDLFWTCRVCARVKSSSVRG